MVAEAAVVEGDSHRIRRVWVELGGAARGAPRLRCLARPREEVRHGRENAARRDDVIICNDFQSLRLAQIWVGVARS